MRRAYILCATPRSGSTLLCDLLRDAGAGRPASFFRAESVPDYTRCFGLGPAPGPGVDRAYLDHVLEAGDGGTGVFGLRLMWESLAGLCHGLRRLFPRVAGEAALLAAAFGAPGYVHLSRADKAAQAVSRLRAMQSGLWHRHADGAERERLAPTAPSGYDASRLAALAAEAAAHDAAWTAWFSREGIAPTTLTYEGLAEDPSGTLATLLRALDLDPGVAATLQPRTRRLADAESAAWLRRFRAEREG